MEGKNYHQGISKTRRGKRVKGVVADYSLSEESVHRQTVFIKDLSAYGVCIYAQRKIDIDTILYMNLYFSGNPQAFEVRGRVVWQSMSEYLGYHCVGIEFFGLSQDEQDKLLKYISSILS